VIDIYVNCYANKEQIENIDLSIKKIVDSKIFNKMIKLYFDYAFTNMYTNIFDGLISIIICENTPSELVKATFEIEEDNSKNLISLLVNDLINNPKFKYESSNNTTCSILFSNHCDLLKQIFQSKHPIILELIEKDKNIKFFNDDFVTKISDKFSKKLLAEELDEGAKNDYMSPLYDIDSSTKKDTEVKLSKFSINEEIDLHFRIYDKFIKGENYQDLLKEDEEEKEDEKEDEKEEEKEEEKKEKKKKKIVKKVVKKGGKKGKQENLLIKLLQEKQQQAREREEQLAKEEAERIKREEEEIKENNILLQRKEEEKKKKKKK
jgi:hypothetical protein